MSGIQIKDLSFAYEAGGKLILKDINTEIGEGEFVCILGQSGCGKSAAVIVPGRSRYFLAAGACAFLISDSLIAVRTIEKKQSLLMGAVLLTLYYGAVYMMGMSVYMH